MVFGEHFESAGPFCVGAVAAPFADPQELQLMRLSKKVYAGAQFLITQPVYDLERFGGWLEQVMQGGLGEKTAILAGIRPLLAAEQAQTYAAQRPSPRVPQALLDKLSAAGDPAAQRAAGIEQAVETIKQISAFERDSRFPDRRRGRRRGRPRDHGTFRIGGPLAVPAKYHIHTEPVRPRYRPIGKLGIVDWREDCSNCRNCVKRACVYGFYREESDALREELGFLDYIYQCKGCLTCVQDCTKGILTRVINPEYKLLGDSYYTPEIIQSNWYQAETGSIPVSGSGYGGPFSGPDFDSMWTDMSEIVRPTRDGIHGREYISTSVDIGRKLASLEFEQGRMLSTPPPLMEIPLPIVFDVMPQRFRHGNVLKAWRRRPRRSAPCS